MALIGILSTSDFVVLLTEPGLSAFLVAAIEARGVDLRGFPPMESSDENRKFSDLDYVSFSRLRS